MNFSGTVQNGVVVFDSPQQLADGTRVQIIVPVESTKKPTLCERLTQLAGTVDALPADMARNHDHYIRGTPKQ